jgi:hypothetical protein
VQGHPDGFPDAWFPEAEVLARHREDAPLQGLAVWGASADARRDAASDAADLRQQRQADAAEKSAGPEPDVRELAAVRRQ